jgi:hypothetical protein
LDNKYCQKCKTALIKCSDCTGSGKQSGNKCVKCNGTGYVCHVHGGNWK